MALFALAFTLLGALLLYLAAPRQAWLATPLPPRRARAAAASSLLAALLAWQMTTTLVTGLFILITLLMVLFPAFPCLALLRRRAAGT
jgi:hypothetical protein